MKKSGKILIPAAVLLLAGPIIFFWTTRTRRRPPERIVLITLDTLRADHLGCYGYPRPASPFIDSLARNSVVFKKAFSAIPSTVPSHAALFTSLYPFQLNVQQNDHRLSDSYFTLAEALREKNYHTAAFVSTALQFTATNLDQGFDEFNHHKFPEAPRQSFMPSDPYHQVEESFDNLPDRPERLPAINGSAQDPANPRSPLPEVAPPPPASAIATDGSMMPYRPADETVAAAIKWLQERKPTEKFFLWIHLFDPHAPYIPPRRFIDSVTETTDEEKNAFIKFLLEQQHVDSKLYDDINAELIALIVDLRPYGNKKGNKIEAMLRTINAYDGEVRFVDTELERFYHYFRKNGFGANALWIVASDHGEGLGNHYWLAHSENLYNEAIHVPLLIHFFSGRYGGKKVEEVVELVDIFPTLAELTGIRIGDVRGESLIPLFSQSAGPPPRPRLAFSQILPPPRLEFLKDYKGIAEFKEGYQYSLLDGKNKYIYRTEADDEFYNVMEDPYEMNNLAGSSGRTEKRLKTKLREMVDHLRTSPDSHPRRIEGEALEELKALGYIQ